jgi:hypothetical protein
MAETLKILWVCGLGLQALILIWLMAKKLYRQFPAIFGYLLVGLLQGPVMFIVYKTKGYSSWPAFWAGWISQAVVVACRWLAVCEVCRTALQQFEGVWALTWRVLAVLGSSALLLALSLGGHDFVKMFTTFDLSLEVSMATVLLVFFVFARYYKVVVQNSLRTMAIAFCLYSLFRGFNDLVLQKFLRNYAETWNLVDETTYLATLVLLGCAAYLLNTAPLPRVVLLPRSAYAEFVPQVSEKLLLLNERLGEILRSKQAGKA